MTGCSGCRRGLVWAAVVFLLVGCQGRHRPRTNADFCNAGPRYAEACILFTQRTAQLEWLKTADPVVDARAAIAAGDPPLIGLYGYSEYFPGAGAIDFRAASCRIRMIEGTSDYQSNEALRLQEIGDHYAEIYNGLVMPHSSCRLRDMPSNDRSLPSPAA